MTTRRGPDVALGPDVARGPDVVHHWRTYIQMKDVLYRIHMYIEMKDYCIEFGEVLIRLSFTALLRFPGSLVVRIRRSHRRGRGSIPRQGGCFKQCLDIQTVV